MAEWVSIFINLLLVLVTFSTVLYASRTLMMEYSSQVIVSRIRKNINTRKYYKYSWKVNVENVGKGYIVKAFILLTVRPKGGFRKYYYLSKPAVGINPKESRTLNLSLKETHLENTDLINKNEKVEVIYQDALNNIYCVEPGLSNVSDFHRHLESFDKLPKKLNKFWINYWIYLYKIRKSIKQKNSYPQRLEEEFAIKRKKYEPLINNLKFIPMDSIDNNK